MNTHLSEVLRELILVRSWQFLLSPYLLNFLNVNFIHALSGNAKTEGVMSLIWAENHALLLI